jgi:hypothetical protein
VNDDASPRPEATNGPWRIVILDRDPDDPMWIIATVTIAADVRPASVDGWTRADNPSACDRKRESPRRPCPGDSPLYSGTAAP